MKNNFKHFKETPSNKLSSWTKYFDNNHEHGFRVKKKLTRKEQEKLDEKLDNINSILERENHLQSLVRRQILLEFDTVETERYGDKYINTMPFQIFSGTSYIHYYESKPKILLEFYAIDDERYGDKYIDNTINTMPGYIYVPYTPMMTTPLKPLKPDPIEGFEIEDFEPSEEIKSRYANKQINPNFYGHINIRAEY